jgi:GT2 family glycosyltransferase
MPILPGNFYYLTGCCLLIRRKVFESIGLFDEDFFMYGEDVEFCHRAVSNKYCLGIVPNAVIYHKTGSSSVQNSLFYEYHINRAHFLLSGKLSGSTRLMKIFTMLLKLFFLGLRAFVRTCRFRNLNALRGYAKALTEAALFR